MMKDYNHMLNHMNATISSLQEDYGYNPKLFNVSREDFMSNLIGTDLRIPESAYAYMQSEEYGFGVVSVSEAFHGDNECYCYSHGSIRPLPPLVEFEICVDVNYNNISNQGFLSDFFI
ncbi:hypothetical protein JHK87_055735 [Glycine soja]|nr:hypothetical protein JHK87_055735 [Glycine soja]